MSGQGGRFGGNANYRRRAGLTYVLGRLDDINKNCLEEFRKHWQCLDNNNQQLWHCRRPEQLLNACVFDKLVRLSLPDIESTQLRLSSRNLRRRSLERRKTKLLYTCGTGKYSLIMFQAFVHQSRGHRGSLMNVYIGVSRRGLVISWKGCGRNK